MDEVITPQIGNCTIFARYVETSFATQVILNARLTRFYEREDWRLLLEDTQSISPFLLERGVSLLEQLEVEGSDKGQTSDETMGDEASTIERAARAKLTEIREQTQRTAGTSVKLVTVDELRARLKTSQPEINP